MIMHIAAAELAAARRARCPAKPCLARSDSSLPFSEMKNYSIQPQLAGRGTSATSVAPRQTFESPAARHSFPFLE